MLRIRERFSIAIVFAFTAGVLAACSGGGGGSSLPQIAPQQPPASSNPVPDSNVVTLNVSQTLPPYSNFKYHIMPVQSNGLRPMGVVFPFDMTNHGGPKLATSQQHEVFINTTPAAVGNPQVFQTNFSNSTFVHVLDQYVGSTANNRYPVNATLFATTISLFGSHMISQNQLFAVLHAAVATTHLSGLGHTYNLFLKSGLDTCIDFGPCYSPDVPSTFAFCAYHGSITFSDVGHVIFSIIPFQHTPGCGDDFPGLTLPNPVPVDDTATALSHEESEDITDPDLNAWFSDFSGFEVGDNCVGFRANENLAGHTFLIQPEHSNSAHGCFF
jgi:hypothetical protein